MTRALPFTEASLRRAISAARKAGLRVMGIRPDGTLLVSDGDGGSDGVAGAADRSESGAGASRSRWEDVRA